MKNKILAIDDSEIIRNIVTQTLQIGGYQVVTAENGQAGLDKFTGEEFDMVVTDINMPIMDGLTVIKEVRKLNSDIPILVLLTESDGQMLDAGNIAGANGWVVKPLNPQQFIDLVDQIMAVEAA